MDYLTTTPQAGETCFSAQELHVYRHVDIEKLQSKAPISDKTLVNSDNRARCSVAIPKAAHEKGLINEECSNLGGAQWIA